MTFKTYLGLVRVYWKTFVGVTLAVALAGIGALLLNPKTYVSTTQLMVSVQGSTTASAYQNDDVVAGRIDSYIPLLTSEVISQRVVDKLGLQMSADQLSRKISATNVPPRTAIIDVAVTDTSAAAAQQLASTVAAEFISYTATLETPTGEDDQKVTTTIITPATEAVPRYRERVLVAVLIALGAALAGAVAVWLRAATDSVVRSPHSAAEAAGVPVLAQIHTRDNLALDDLDAYSQVRSHRALLPDGHAGFVVGLVAVDTLAAPAVARRLARVNELANRRSVIVDATFDDDTRLSWTALDHSLSDWTPAGVRPDVVALGARGDIPERAMGQESAGLVARLRRDYDDVIIVVLAAGSPVTAFAMSEYADAVVLLVNLKSTKRRSLVVAGRRFRAAGALLAGVVLIIDDRDTVAKKTRGSSG